MADALLSWILRWKQGEASFDGRLAGRSVMVYEPPSPDPSSDPHQLRTLSGVDGSIVGGGSPMVIFLEKSKDNVFQSRVTIGRTTNNDVVLDDASVSRFHGWLHRDEVRAQWVLTDAGSKNGTWVADVQLVAKKACALENNARLRIGSVTLTFYTATGFRELIRALPPLRD